MGDLLKKYCHFLPIPIVFGKVKEWKDGKYVDTAKDNVINNTAPLWTLKPTEITEQQYKDFYQELYPMSDEPLFYIHLNIDYPFNLTGILYFPKIHNNFEIQKNKIQLYCNQVFVTDEVNGIVPEYLTLLHGVIDSPDIPLNVSRSYLQSDSNVKKISSYITRKVADRLAELFNTMREEYEQKWDDLKIFIQYGTLTDEKFAEKSPSFMLWKTIEGKYFTPTEFTEAVKDNQTDKNDTLILLYTDDVIGKHSFIEGAKAKGYQVLEMGGQLDSHYINWYEQKNENTRFVRVDSDIVDRLIRKKEENKISLSEAQQKKAEGDNILRLLQTSDFVTLLDERGTQPTSEEFADWMQKRMASGCKRLVFVIGGPYGFSEEVYGRANGKISLSRMTFSHQMVRVIFAEQFYRALSILNNLPYHHV